MLEQENIDVLLLQETRIMHQEQLMRLRRQLEVIHYALLCEFPSKYLATIINTKKVTSYGLVHNEERLQVIRIVCGSETVTLANHYGPHKTDGEHYRRVREVLSGISTAGKVIFGGDHNAVVTKEDRTSGRRDANTTELNNTLSSCNMHDINQALGVHRFHTFYKKTMSSRIDSTWANKAALCCVSSIEALTSNGAPSDHIPTRVSVTTDQEHAIEEEKMCMVFTKNKKDKKWIQYAEEVMGDLSKHGIGSLRDTNEQSQLITDILSARALEYFGTKKMDKRWTENRRVRRLLRSRRLLLEYLVNGVDNDSVRKIVNSHSESAGGVGRGTVWEVLGVVNTKLHRERVRNRNSKFRRWEWAVRTSEYVNPSKFFSAASAKKSNRVRLNTVEDDGMIYTDKDRVSESAAHYFESVFSQTKADMSYLQEIEMPDNREVISKEFCDITTEEVREAIRWLRNRKCPGPDGIHNEMLKMPSTENRDYSMEFAEVLCILFNNILRSGVFPGGWKECTIIPAYKKGSAQDLANYRPICLLSSLSKLFTRLLNVRVSKAAEAASLFTNTQGGGRKFRDIREKLSIMKGVIDHANRNDSQLYILLTDIAKAFDSVPHNAIKEVYSFFGFPQHIVRLVLDMVSNNWARVMTGKLSRRFQIGKGTRQGDSLSPTTYVLVHQTVLLYTAKYAKGYQAMSQNIWNVAYVDDCNLMSNDRCDIEQTANRMSQVLGKLKMVMHPNKLELYVRKIEGETNEHNIRVSGVDVPACTREKVFRALGLFTNLRGCSAKQKEQARDKVERVISRLHILRLTARQTARVVNSCIHPVFLYAAEFTEWTKVWIKRVDQMGKKLIKRGSVAMLRYPTELLHVACDNGGFGLRKIEESLVVNTAWFITNMLKGKRDSEAHRLMLDSLEEIRHQQTFQMENVFQSNNRLEGVKHSYLKWCAERMHDNYLSITYGNEINCLSCNLSISTQGHSQEAVYDWYM